MIYTIGHSTHTAEAFLGLLHLHQIAQVADIRTVPRSRRHPQFGSEALESFLRLHGIAYRHFPELGGLRKPRPDSINTAWRVAGFRGYADHMATPAFRAGVETLLHFADADHTTVMCAESLWWQCHRRLLADALVVQGVAVYHILPSGPPKAHELSEFARISNGSVIYPGLL